MICPQAQLKTKFPLNCLLLPICKFDYSSIMFMCFFLDCWFYFGFITQDKNVPESLASFNNFQRHKNVLPNPAALIVTLLHEVVLCIDIFINKRPNFSK